MLRPSRSVVLLPALLGVATIAAACSSASPATDDRAARVGDTAAALEVANATRVKEIASARGISNAVVVAGVAYAESRLTQCFSEYGGAKCAGPASTDCGGGAVLAGGNDGNCNLEQGGLGMFQFDSGTYSQTLAAYGTSILTVDGNIAAGIDYILKRVLGYDQGGGWPGCADTPHMVTEADAIAWLDAATIGSPSYDIYTGCLSTNYNGTTKGTQQYYDEKAYYDQMIRAAETDFASVWGTSDPCTGWSDADDCGAAIHADPTMLYACRGGRTVGRHTCPSGCFENGPGQSDACRPYWTSSAPPDAVDGGHEANGAPLYVCRAQYSGGVHSGKIVGSGCNFGWGGKEHSVSPFERLGGNADVWEAASGGVLPPGAVVGGHEANGAPLYVCRTAYNGGVHPGKTVGAACNIGWGGKEISRTTYDVLVSR